MRAGRGGLCGAGGGRQWVGVGGSGWRDPLTGESDESWVGVVVVEVGGTQDAKPLSQKPLSQILPVLGTKHAI